MKKVATYCRVSIHNNSDQALEKQQERVAKYCEKNGYEVADSFCITGDRATGLAMFLDCLQTAKESGVDTIVMASTNRIVGSVEEMETVRKAYETSGVALEDRKSFVQFFGGSKVPNFYEKINLCVKSAINW